MSNMDAQSKDLDSFYQETDEKHLIPLWKVTAKLLPPEPQTKVLPYSGTGPICAGWRTAPASLAHRTRRRLFRGPALGLA